MTAAIPRGSGDEVSDGRPVAQSLDVAQPARFATVRWLETIPLPPTGLDYLAS
jgi:hypothetical protein